MTNVITVNEIMSLRPCDNYPRERVEQLVGNGLTAAEIARLDIDIADRRWVLTQANFSGRYVANAATYAAHASTFNDRPEGVADDFEQRNLDRLAEIIDAGGE